MKLIILEPEYVEYMPQKQKLEYGKLYISDRFRLAIHLCACGCGGATVTPLDEWSLTKNGEKVTLRPSIGNWSGESPYHAHYFITDNKIEWL